MIGTLDGFRAWAADRGDQAPTAAPDADATAALVRASDHMEFHYMPRFRAGLGADAPNVEPATYELARLELATPGLFSRVFTPGERKVLTEADGIKWTVLDDGSEASAPVSSRVEAMMAPYLTRPGPAVFSV